jgi:hypothetical protein
MIVFKHGEYLHEELKKSVTAIAELTKRVSGLERTLKMAGIVEVLDKSDIVTLGCDDPWSLNESEQYKVKKVKK